MSPIYIEIESLDSMTQLLTEAKRKGLLKDISPEKVRIAFSDKTFPIRVPVDLGSVLELTRTPIGKMVGSKIEKPILTFLNMAIRAE